MDFCEANGIDYVLGLPTNAVLRADPAIVTVADACATQRAEEDRPVLRLFAETRYAAKSWKHQRRVVARIEASTMGVDIRTVVTSLTVPGPEDLYKVYYCARGNAENLIKLHKSQLSSDRTSCRSANANQMRLILHTAAYWLMWRVQQAIPKKPRSPPQSSPQCACVSSKSPPALSKHPPASGSRSLPPAQMQTCSAPSPARSSQRRHSQRGNAAEPPNPALQTCKPLDQPR